MPQESVTTVFSLRTSRQTRLEPPAREHRRQKSRSGADKRMLLSFMKLSFENRRTSKKHSRKKNVREQRGNHLNSIRSPAFVRVPQILGFPPTCVTLSSPGLSCEGGGTVTCSTAHFCLCFRISFFLSSACCERSRAQRTTTPESTPSKSLPKTRVKVAKRSKRQPRDNLKRARLDHHRCHNLTHQNLRLKPGGT